MWSDVRRFLEEPGEILERLREQHDAANDAGELEARRKELAKRLAAKQAEKGPLRQGLRPETHLGGGASRLRG